MSIADTDVKAKYNANGVTTTFAIPHAIVETAADEVEVMTVDESTTPATETVKTITTHYTISGSNVVFNSAPANGLKVLISRKFTLTQPQDLDVNAAFPAAATEVSLDRLVAMIQMLDEKIKRALKFRKSNTADTEVEIPDMSGMAAKTIVVNATEDGFEAGPTTDEISNAQTYATAAQAAQTASEAAQAAAELAETNAETAETNAEAAQAAAEAAQAAAEAAVVSITWNDVSFKTFADSPISVVDASNGVLYSIDASGGNVVVNLDQIANLGLGVPWTVGFKKTDSSANTVTINPGGTDTIDDGTSLVLRIQGQAVTLVPDTDPAPDAWTSVAFGPTLYDVTAASAFGTDNRLVRTDGAVRGVQSSGITISDSDAVSGVTQLDVDNIRVDGNTISSTDANGDVNIEPNGTGLVKSTKKSAFTGAMAIGQATAAAASAIVEMVSTTQGFLPPRMTTAQRNAIGTPAEGLVVFDTDFNKLYVYTGSAWSPAGSGGGGGGALQWVEPVGNAPTPTEENYNKVYLFESGLAQELYAVVRVPSSYSAGNQINMKVPYYSPDNSGTALLSTVATLIRTGTDAISSTTNQRTSTNSATTLTSANVALSHTCDLTSSTGEINSVAVSAGDLIIVKLTRGTDTATSDIRALVYGAEVTFN